MSGIFAVFGGKRRILVIHQYRNNGYNIVMDVASGSVHVVDDIVYEAIALLSQEVGELEKPKPLPEKLCGQVRGQLAGQGWGARDIDEALEEIQYLVDEGELFTKDIYQEYVADFKKRKTVVKALCRHVAHDCNLGCRYCLGGEGE